MLRLENVATPATAFTVSVPANVPLDGFVPIATVTALVAVVTGFPEASPTVTVTAGVIVAPATTLEGCTVKASFDAVPTPLPAARKATICIIHLPEGDIGAVAL